MQKSHHFQNYLMMLRKEDNLFGFLINLIPI